MKVYEPVQQLAVREAVRFVGTVGEIISDVCPLYVSIIEAFTGHEVRNEAELIEIIQEHRKNTGKEKCNQLVAKHTLEVASSLRLLDPIPFGSGRYRKFGLGIGGRVILALRSHSKWSAQKASLVLRKPMFEYNGDYMLQAMVAIHEHPDRSEQLNRFTTLVRSLATAKLDELPSSRSGVNWDIYVQELKHRQWWVSDKTTVDRENKPTLEELKREREYREKRFKQSIRQQKAQAHEESTEKSESKTFSHHFVRCRGWLSELGLVHRVGSNDELTREGIRLLNYFREANKQAGPIRIPPTAALLHDAFRLSEKEIADAWGVIVDDQYWENGLFDLTAFGSYSPNENEFYNVFSWAFDKVRFQHVSEAPIQAIHDVIFQAFFWNDKPLHSAQLTELIKNLLTSRADAFGAGNNRQGRLAFIFRKKS